MADPGDKKRRATYQDVLDADERLVAEIIGGELRLSPRPGGPHTRVTSQLGGALVPPFDNGDGGPGGWIILDEPELHVGADDDLEIVVPDLAGWRRERFDTAWLGGNYFTCAPDWVCEVLSTRTATNDRIEKLPLYARAGVQYAWLVHPVYRSLEVFRLTDERQWLSVATHVGDQVVRAVPFDAIELDLSRLWSDVPRPPRRGGGRASEAGEAGEAGEGPEARWSFAEDYDVL